MLVRSLVLSIALLMSAGCSHERELSLVEDGKVGLQLAEIDEASFAVVVVNGSGTELVIDGLFKVGYAQSVVSYEVKGTDKDATLISSVSMPLLVDPEKYRMRLASGAIYGAVNSKDDFMSIYQLQAGTCYDIRAKYTPRDASYSPVVLESNFVRICF